MAIPVSTNDVGQLVLNVLFGKPGLPERLAVGDEDLICSIGGVPIVVNEHHGDILTTSVVNEAISKFGIDHISDRFRGIFANSSSQYAVTHVLSYMGLIFARFCALARVAQQFQADGVQVQLMRMTWQMVRTADDYAEPGVLAGKGMELVMRLGLSSSYYGRDLRASVS